jgi:hypothetical protein
MFTGYMFPFYRSPYAIGYPGFGYPGYAYQGYGSYTGINAIGSAIANQNMNVIGAGAIGGIQTATPTVIW